MMRSTAIAVIGMLFLVGSVWSSEVTNVEIGYQDGATVARIDIEGPVRFSHETEVPKEGRPNRVIVDVLSATHELGAKEFTELPACVVTGVRTSQYSVTPEKIVRIVFDLTSAAVYQVAADNKSITIRFNQKNTKAFTTWSTAAVVAASKAGKKMSLAAKPKKSSAPVSLAKQPSKVARQNRAIEKDRQSSLASKNPPAKVTKPKTTVAKATPKVKAKASVASVSPDYPAKTSDRRFASRTYSDMPNSPAPKLVVPAVKAAPKPTASVAKKVEKKTVVAQAPKPAAKIAKVAPKAAPKPTASVAKKVEKKTVVAQAAKPTASAAKPMASVAKKSVKKIVVAQAPPSGQKALAQKVAGSPKAKSSAPKVKSKAKVKPAALANQRPTARFRRKAPSAKIRGTMVAEFPKRLVIKYKSGGRRDPFGGLIDANRTNNNPIGTRIPNVEGLRLVGIIDVDGSSNSALFEDKIGYSYMLKSGDKVRNGYVLRVEEEQVYFQVFEYGWSRTVALTME